MFREDYRVLLLHGVPEQAQGVVRRGGHCHPQSRHGGKPTLQTLGVGGSHRSSAAGHGSYHQWRRELASRHIAQLGGVIHYLVHCQKAEVDGHQLHNGPQAGHCRSRTRSDYHGLGYGCLTDALWPELRQQSPGYGVCAAVLSHVLAHEENTLILHGLSKGPGHCIPVSNLGHVLLRVDVLE